MKRYSILLALLFLPFLYLKAQLDYGDVAPDFTVTDIDGNTWNLYDILDEGKSVILDFSATWCTPCWDYHEEGTLKELYNQYGPNGSDELMVFMVEGDPTTNVDCLYNLPGCNSSTLGDWVTDTPYPIIDNSALTATDMYNIAYWPTLYYICSNRIIREFDGGTVSEVYELGDICTEASGVNNAAALKTTSFSDWFCESETFAPSFLLQNLGSDNLTSATIQLYVSDVPTETIEWTGNLSTYQMEEATFSEITTTADGFYQMEILSVNGVSDEDESNNIEGGGFLLAPETDQNNLTLLLQTDDEPIQISWELIDDNDNVLYSGGNEIASGNLDVSIAYQDDNTLYTIPIPLPGNGCYSFNIYDLGQDGICCFSGEGSYQLVDENGNVVVEGGEFESEDIKPFHIEGNTTPLENNGAIIGYSGASGSFCDNFSYSPEIRLQNLGANEITSATITVNSSTTGVLFTKEWTGSILSGQYTLVDLDPISLEETTTITTTISAINGQPDEFEHKNEITADFTYYSTESTELTMELQLDEYAYEIYWEFTNSSGEIVASGGNENCRPKWWRT